MNKINKLIITGVLFSTTLVLACIIAPAVAVAMDCPSVNGPPANEGTVVLAQDSAVTVTVSFDCGGAVDTDYFGLSSPTKITFASNKTTSNGAVYSVGTFKAGQELIFFINDSNHGQTFYTGPASRNFNNQVEADFRNVSANSWTIGFSDQGNPNNEYNDLVITVTATPVVPACTPSWQTGTWGTCINGQQTRTVTDLNNCGVTTNKPITTQACTIACSTDTDCGTNVFTGSPFCQGNSVYQRYITYTCNNPGTSTSYCSNDTASQLKTTCQDNQTCANGSCNTQNITCSTNTDCGTNVFTGSPFCQGNSVYQNYISYTCNNPGTSTSYCSNDTASQLKTTCQGNQTCNGGTCSGTTCTYHSYQQCQGNTLYWYDSCGTQQDSTYCPNGCSGNTCTNYNYVTSNLTLTKTVRNLTNGSGFSNLAYANPGDTLMFMITVQNPGSADVQNVVVRDYLPANLIYNNQLTVACTTNNNIYNNTYNSTYNSTYNNCSGGNYNYTGNVSSGVYLNTVYAGQTVTITYQVQVAGATNFAFGTTTLNNNASATSNNGSNPTASASVIVTRGAVLGASSVSTGLTNNFWADSFFLPLLITLIVLWMWKAGLFFGIERWLDNIQKKRRGHKTEKEFAKKGLPKLKN